MNINLPLITALLSILAFTSCENKNPNLNDSGKDSLKSHELDHQINKKEMAYEDLIYVPIYSDMYIDAETPKCLFASTLSIRNTSYQDSLFISKIDYFNTSGELVRSFINNPISLPPMATINYVIEKEDDTGGSGANFIVSISSKNKNVKPLIQAVMIGHNGNRGYAFSTAGQSIK